MSTAAWATPKAHQQAPARSWCFQCGEEGRPTPAIGWDEDDEPACSGHAKKAATPLKLSEPIELPPCVAEPIQPTAAPSPVQTSAEEANVRQTPQFKTRKCIDCDVDFVPTGARSQRCEGCKINHDKADDRVKSTRYYQKKTKKAPTSVAQPAPLRTCLTPTDQVAIYLPVEKLDKLWNLLSLDEKVAAISHVL